MMDTAANILLKKTASIIIIHLLQVVAACFFLSFQIENEDDYIRANTKDFDAYSDVA